MKRGLVKDHQDYASSVLQQAQGCHQSSHAAAAPGPSGRRETATLGCRCQRKRLHNTRDDYMTCPQAPSGMRALPTRWTSSWMPTAASAGPPPAPGGTRPWNTRKLWRNSGLSETKLSICILFCKGTIYFCRPTLVRTSLVYRPSLDRMARYVRCCQGA